MANQYKNKIIYNGTTLMDISDTTAIASDVGLGKDFYTASGAKAQGTAVTGNAISVVDTTDSNGGTIRTITAVDISDTTAVAADVAQGKYFYTANGTKTAGTASGGGSSPTLITKEITTNGTYTASSDSADGYSSVTVNVPSSGITPTGSINITTNGTHDVTNYASAVVSVPTSGGGGSSGTQHTILFEFENETTATITAYYDNTFISNAITATTPTTYDSKTVTRAQLDGVTWYEVSGDIPLNTELVDYNAVRAGYIVGDSGAIEAGEAWECVTDYLPIDSSMIFTFKMLDWYTLGLYDANKNVVQVYGSHDIADSTGNNTATGTLSSSRIPSTAKYVVLVGNPYNLSSNNLSLIRTA